jgi:hypothetical protein
MGLFDWVKPKKQESMPSAPVQSEHDVSSLELPPLPELDDHLSTSLPMDQAIDMSAVNGLQQTTPVLLDVPAHDEDLHADAQQSVTSIPAVSMPAFASEQTHADQQIPVPANPQVPASSSNEFIAISTYSQVVDSFGAIKSDMNSMTSYVEKMHTAEDGLKMQFDSLKDSLHTISRTVLLMDQKLFGR